MPLSNSRNDACAYEILGMMHALIKLKFLPTAVRNSQKQHKHESVSTSVVA